MKERKVMKKWQAYSIGKLQQAIASIEQLAPLEEKRSSRQRKKSLEQDYSTLKVHCGRLDFKIPRLGVWYDPGEYVNVAREVHEAVVLFLATDVEK